MTIYRQKPFCLQFGFQFGLYRVSISLASLFTSLSIFGLSDLSQILRIQVVFSFAVLCNIVFLRLLGGE